jgi:hypothetical protein
MGKHYPLPKAFTILVTLSLYYRSNNTIYGQKYPVFRIRIRFMLIRILPKN